MLSLDVFPLLHDIPPRNSHHVPGKDDELVFLLFFQGILTLEGHERKRPRRQERIQGIVREFVKMLSIIFKISTSLLSMIFSLTLLY